jgi:hypothetical protein
MLYPWNNVWGGFGEAGWNIGQLFAMILGCFSSVQGAGYRYSRLKVEKSSYKPDFIFNFAATVAKVADEASWLRCSHAAAPAHGDGNSWI